MRNLIMTRSIFVTIIIFNILSRNSANPTPLAPALYVLGDSLLDNGNNNMLPTLARANFAPYGMNFPDGATGRFTNGRTPADFIAEYLRLPYAPPFLSISRALLRPEQLTGINFASGACGILPETGKPFGKCMSLADQVNLFERIVQNDLPKYFPGPSKLSEYLSGSLFLISVGSNDYLNNYLNALNDTNRKVYTPESFGKLLVDRLSLQLQRLYNMGARKIITFELGPIGCIPSVSRKFKHTGLCNEEMNQLPVHFNNHLEPMLKNLTSSLKGSDFVSFHIYKSSYEVVTHASKYGFIDTTNPCCLAALNGTAVCIPELRAQVCRDPEKHYFWDGYHPTEGVFRTAALSCISDSSICVPKSIKQLVKKARKS